MQKTLLLVVLILVTALTGWVRGESAENVADLPLNFAEALTLDQCIEIALQRSPSIRMADLDLESAKLDVSDAFADYLPEVDISGQYRFSDQIDFGWERQNYDAQIVASYTIWDHGRRKAEMAQAKSSQRAVNSDYDRTKQNIIFNITQAYYGLLEAEKLIDVNQDLLKISKANVDKVTAFEEAGRSIPSDVAAARVQQGNNELAFINARNNFELARARLASLMGLEPDIPIEITDTGEIPASLGQDDTGYDLYTQADLFTSDISLEDSIAKAIENRPELNRLQERMISLEWSLRLAKLNRWPVITAECNFDVLLDDYLRDRDNFDRYRHWNAIARISFPIFDSGVSKRREENSEIAIKQTEEDINERERDIALEVQQAYLNSVRSQKSLEIAREQVKNATESLNATQGRYEQNMVIFLEVLSAQARYAQALINQVRAFYDYKIAERALQRAMGTLQVNN